MAVAARPLEGVSGRFSDGEANRKELKTPLKQLREQAANAAKRAARMSRHEALLALNDASRVLIVKLSAIGDVIHALPVAAALKEAYPLLAIDWAVEEPFVPLLSGNPDLRNVIPLPKLRGSRLRSASFRRDYRRRLRDLRENRYDVSLDLQG